MHYSSMLRMKCFIEHYVEKGGGKKVLDVGSCNIGGCYKPLFNGTGIQYTGLDIEPGANVDVVMEDPYCWDSLEDEGYDYIISGQAFEHIEYPWQTIKEIYKKLRPDGVICIIVPNSFWEHRYPTDCYRYYSDGMRALAKWAGFRVIEVSVAGIPDSNASLDFDNINNDVCLVACKSDEIFEKYAANIMFPIERRYEPIYDLQRQYDFISNWNYYRERMDKWIVHYIHAKDYKKIYIIGYEKAGSFVERLLSKSGIAYEVLHVEKRVMTEKLSIEYGSILEHKVIENAQSNSLCILAVLDGKREMINFVRQQFPSYAICYLDDLAEKAKNLEFDNEVKCVRDLSLNCPAIYIYGAGQNGKRIYSILEKNNIKISGFALSDDHYNEGDSSIIPISKVSNESGIIISPKDDAEIKDILYKLEFRYIFDGKRLLNFD